MGLLATSVSTKVIYAPELNWNVKPAVGTGKLLRRVSVDLNLRRNSYVSNEIRSDYQNSDMRLGVRSTEGKISAELSTGTYADFWAALTRKDWVSLTPIIKTDVSFTATTIVRASGTWASDGIRIGDLIKVTGAAAPANNGQRIVIGMTATVLTMDTSALAQVVAAAGPAITIISAGKKTFVPQTGHLDKSFTFEKFYDMSATDVSEVFTGCKIADAAVKVGVDAMSTVDFSIMGAGFSTSASQYFTAPAASATNGVLSGAKGYIYLNGAQSGLVTSFDFNVKSGAANATTIASVNVADIILSRVEVEGNLQVYFMDNTLLAAMDAETEYHIVLSLAGNGDESFLVSMPRVKLGEVTKDDPSTGAIVQSMKFTALRPLDSQTNTDLSVIVFQDTTL